MKKQKLKLNELKVKSFTTEVLEDNQANLQGGGGIRLNTQPQCGLISIFFVCKIVATNDWQAECPG